MPLEEGHCYEKKKISLNPTTERIDPILKSNCYCFSNFIDVYHGLAHPNFSIGLSNNEYMIFSYETNIYGAVVGVGFLEEYMNEDGNNAYVLNFFFTTYGNVLVKCVAYGTLAHAFQDLWDSTNADVVLCVLQSIQELNIDGFFKVVFEPYDVEIDAFRK
ncbi:hypothetical protein IGI04_001905, partial [Brassica rapa subsp. trilocularis]